jgi:hypothetical protein
MATYPESVSWREVRREDHGEGDEEVDGGYMEGVEVCEGSE